MIFVAMNIQCSKEVARCNEYILVKIPNIIDTWQHVCKFSFLLIK